jgi:organic radical activating enzyme
MEEKSVRLIENFVSWQGEGPDSGSTMIILRFKTCNRNCPWCDTSVKMRISSEAPYTLSDIQKTIDERAAGLLITGGEPTVPKHFDETVMLLNELNYPIANVETNGFNVAGLLEKIDERMKPVKVILSPKVFNQNDVHDYMDIMKKIKNHSKLYLKLVYEPDNDYSMVFLEYVAYTLKDMIRNQRVWLMPKGVTRSELITNSGPVFDACEKYNFNFSSRDHVMFGFV